MALAMTFEFILGQLPEASKNFYSKIFIVKAVLCFSPYTNLKKIAKTTDANASGQFGCLIGMRYDWEII